MRRRQKHGDECRRRPLGDRPIPIHCCLPVHCCLPASRSHSPYSWPQLNGNAATDERSRPCQDGRRAAVACGITGAFTSEHAATRTTCGDRVFNDANSPCPRHRIHARRSGRRKNTDRRSRTTCWQDVSSSSNHAETTSTSPRRLPGSVSNPSETRASVIGCCGWSSTGYVPPTRRYRLTAWRRLRPRKLRDPLGEWPLRFCEDDWRVSRRQLRYLD
jgi:hypothetical protein